jgi:hypothetical protein
VKAAGLLSVALSAAVLSSGCGYRLVRHSEVFAQQIADDSAKIQSLEMQLTMLQVKCRDDSIRLENEITARRAAVAAITAAAPTPPSDSLLKARTAEVAVLKDQLTKVSEELDRIKRRLANPRG